MGEKQVRKWGGTKELCNYQKKDLNKEIGVRRGNRHRKRREIEVKELFQGGRISFKKSKVRVF